MSDANNTPNNLGNALINSTQMTVTTDATFTSVQISLGGKNILNTGTTMAITGALTITGELEMADGSVVDAGGDVTVAGTLDMDGSSRLKMEEDLSFSGVMEASIHI
jgi:hypothetical protein